MRLQGEHVVRRGESSVAGRRLVIAFGLLTTFLLSPCALSFDVLGVDYSDVPYDASETLTLSGLFELSPPSASDPTVQRYTYAVVCDLDGTGSSFDSFPAVVPTPLPTGSVFSPTLSFSSLPIIDLAPFAPEELSRSVMCSVVSTAHGGAPSLSPPSIPLVLRYFRSPVVTAASSDELDVETLSLTLLGDGFTILRNPSLVIKSPADDTSPFETVILPCVFVSATESLCYSPARISQSYVGRPASLFYSGNSAGHLLPLSSSISFTSSPPTTAAFAYVGNTDDFGWNYAHNRGRIALEATLGSSSVLTSFSDGPDHRGVYDLGCTFSDDCPFACVYDGLWGNTKLSVDDPACAFLQNPGYVSSLDILESLASENDVIVATSFGLMYQLTTAAQKHPDTKFVLISGFVEQLPNVVNLNGRFYQARYVSGVLIGELLQEAYVKTGKNASPAVGTIASFPIPEIYNHVSAFALGLRSACPTCVVKVAYLGTWRNDEWEYWAARRFHEEHDVVAITQNTDSIRPQMYIAEQTTEERPMYGIGEYSDMRQIAGEHTVSSIIANWGVGHSRIVESVRQGRWEGPRSYFLGMQDGAVDLAPMSNEVPEELKAKIAAAMGRITRGEDEVLCYSLHGDILDNTGHQRVGNGECMSDGDINGQDWYSEGVEELGFWSYESMATSSKKMTDGDMVRYFAYAATGCFGLAAIAVFASGSKTEFFMKISAFAHVSVIFAVVDWGLDLLAIAEIVDNGKKELWIIAAAVVAVQSVGGLLLTEFFLVAEVRRNNVSSEDYTGNSVYVSCVKLLSLVTPGAIRHLPFKTTFHEGFPSVRSYVVISFFGLLGEQIPQVIVLIAYINSAGRRQLTPIVVADVCVAVMMCLFWMIMKVSMALFFTYAAVERGKKEDARNPNDARRRGSVDSMAINVIGGLARAAVQDDSNNRIYSQTTLTSLKAVPEGDSSAKVVPLS